MFSISQYQYTVNIGLSLGVVVDIMIAAFLIYELTQTQTALRCVCLFFIRTTALKELSSYRSQVHYVQAVMNLVIGTGALTV